MAIQRVYATRLIAAWFIIVLTFSGCDIPELIVTPEPPAAATLGQKDSGKLVELKSGDSLRISLEANPSTGYEWVVAQSWDELVLELRSKDFKALSTAPGSQGIQAWSFAPRSEGQTSFRLEYKRPWEKSTPALSTFALSVSVRG